MEQAQTTEVHRPVYTFRTTDERMARVTARAHNLGLPNRNAGIEAALEAWADDTDADAPVSLKDILDEVRALRKQVNQLTGQTGGGNQFGPPRTAVRDASAATLKFMSTDPDASPDVIPYPVPEPAKRSRAKSGCGHHVAAGTRCKICQPAAK